MKSLMPLPVLLILLASTAPGAPAKPNIVVILADDLGQGDLGCYGNRTFKTPHLDRMAAEGARFTHFSAPMAFCAPTRAALLTGRYPFRSGMNGNPAPDGGPAANAMALSKDEVLLPQLLKRAGYATGMVGKWHLGHKSPDTLPTGRGFDEYLGIPYSNDMRPVKLLDGTNVVEYPVTQATLTRRTTQRALDFIERNKTRPFFLYFAQVMPHKPLATTEQYYKKSGAGLYGDVLADLDQSVGDVLAKLKSAGVDHRTLVIFTSDNGPWFGGSTGGLRGMKGSSFEGGYRVPCIARWPEVLPSPRLRTEPGVMMDIFATVLAAAGVPPPADRVIDGVNLLPRPDMAHPLERQHVFGQQGPRLATVRDARWKLHVLAPRDNFMALHKPGERWTDPRGPDGFTILAPYEQYQPADHPGLRTGDEPVPMMLFDLQADPGEQKNVAAQHPDVVARLKKAFDEMNAQVPPPSAPPAKAKAKQPVEEH